MWVYTLNLKKLTVTVLLIHRKEKNRLVKDSSKDYWRLFVYVVTQFMRKKALWFAAEIKASKLKPTRADDMIESGSTPSCTQTGQAGTGPDAVHQNSTQKLNSLYEDKQGSFRKRQNRKEGF